MFCNTRFNEVDIGIYLRYGLLPCLQKRGTRECLYGGHDRGRGAGDGAGGRHHGRPRRALPRVAGAALQHLAHALRLLRPRRALGHARSCRYNVTIYDYFKHVF